MKHPPPDFDQLAEMSKRLDEMCRKAEEIRSQITSHRDHPPPWPDRRRESRLFDESEASDTSRKPERG